LHRWGGNIGSLQISAIQTTPTGPQRMLLWERNETQSKEWHIAQLNLRDIPYDFAMKIDGFVGNGWEGDVCHNGLSMIAHVDLIHRFRSVSMKSIFWMMNVRHYFHAILKHRTVDGPMTQQLISIGHALKRQRTVSVLDQRQVDKSSSLFLFLIFFLNEKMTRTFDCT
jgi:hypothetical protein